MATITLRPTSGTGNQWTDVANIYDGDQSTSGSVSTSRLTYVNKTLVLDFDTSVIPSGATINSATLTIRSQGGRNTITAYVDINQDSANRVISQKQTTSASNYTADVTDYMSDLTSVKVTPYNSNWSSNTFILYEVWIDVDYTEATYTVTFKDYDGRIISSYNAPLTSMFTVPNDPVRDGYIFSYWSNAELGEFTKSQLEERTPELLGANGDVEFTAVYNKIYTVRFLDWNNDVLDTQTINDGGNATPPNDPVRDGYRFTGWSGSYTNITADTDITAQYIKIYNIVAFAGTGGTISPSGSVLVDENTDKTFDIKANKGYRVSSVLVDSVNQGAITRYTFNSVTIDHTIEATFEEIPKYEINTSCGVRGYSNPEGIVTVTEGDSIQIEIYSKVGFSIDKITIDGVEETFADIIRSKTIEFTNVTSNHDVVVDFRITPQVVAALEKNKFYAIKIFEGYDKFSIGYDGVYLNAIYEDLNEDENAYLDKDGGLHVYQYIEGIL